LPKVRNPTRTQCDMRVRVKPGHTTMTNSDQSDPPASDDSEVFALGVEREPPIGESPRTTGSGVMRVFVMR
jgi:hypothetical protein